MLRVIIRSLSRSRLFTTVTVVTLALGIGAMTTIFLLVDAVLIRAVPYPAPETLVTVGGVMRRESVEPHPLGLLDIAALRSDDSDFESVAAVTNPRSFNMQAGDEVEHIDGEMVEADYFRTLGVVLELGRPFTFEEARPPAASSVAILSHDLWTRRFGGAPLAGGLTIRLNELQYTIIGVAPRGFRGLSDRAQIWLPLGMAHAIYGAHYTEMRQFRWLFAVARLRPGISVAQAQVTLDQVSDRLQRAFPVENARLGFRATALTEAYLGSFRRPLLFLLGASGFVLLIVCANVANLLLLRTLSRRTEYAIRAALGAESGSLARLALTEGFVLSAFGTMLALVFALVALHALRGSGLLLDLPSFVRPQVGWLVLAVAAGLSLFAAAGSGLGSALVAARAQPGAGLSKARRTSRLQRGLVIMEVGLAFALFAGAGLMTKGFARFVRTDLGFAVDNVLSLRLDLTAERYKSNDAAWTLIRGLVATTQATPGVSDVAIEGPGYPTGGWYQIGLTREGGTAEDKIPARRHHVSPGYFSAMGIKLLRGRDLSTADVPVAPRVVVVNEALVRSAWPGKDPVGQRLFTESSPPVELQVIGVVADVGHDGLQTDDTPRADVYFSVYQSPPRSPSLLTLFARADESPSQLIRPLEARLRELDPALAFYDVETLRGRLDRQTTTARVLIVIMSTFAGLGLLLAGLGIYGIVGHAVSQRTREIGIRMALGAGPGKILAQVLRQSVAPVAAGLVLGLAGIVGLTRFLATLLYGLSPLDPITLAGTAGILLAVAGVASWIPARRAMQTQPTMALRAE